MDAKQWKKKAEALCAQGEHCASQIEEKLRRWGAEEADIAPIIEHLFSEKYLDNERFCRAFTFDKLRYNRWGRFKIRTALRTLGLPDACIQDAMADIDEEEYLDILNKVLDAKARTLRDTDPYIRTGKLVRHAVSRGFETDLALDLVKN